MADISKITLPSGNTYDIKDAVARQQIAGGVSFNIVWTKSDYQASTVFPSKLANIPDEDSEGNPIYVYYNSGASRAQGTLAASVNTVGQFYLIYSESQTAGDVFDEYATIQTGGGSGHSAVYAWEKIGDTQVDLTGLMTNVTTTTDAVLGSGTTLNVTTTKLRAGASNGNVEWNSKDPVDAVTGYSPSTDTFLKHVRPVENEIGTTGKVTVDYVKSIGNQSTTKLSASASGGAVTHNNDDLVDAVTGYNPSTGSAASSVTPTTKKLAVSTIYGVTDQTVTVTGVSGSTTASRVTESTPTNQTTATGSITVVNPSDPASTTDANSNNVYDPDECILVWPNVSNETLVLRAGTLNTQTTQLRNYGIESVTVPIAASNVTTVPIKATSPTTYATGSVTTTGNGADVVTDVEVGNTITVLTALGDPTTDSVIGAATTHSVTNPSVTIASSSSTGDVTVVTDRGTVTPKVLSVEAAATNGTADAITALGTPSTDSVIGADSTFTVTQPTVTLTTGQSGNVDIVTGATINSNDTVTAVTGVTPVYAKESE